MDTFRDEPKTPLYFYDCAQGQLGLEARPSTITPEYFHYVIFEGKTLAE